VFRLLLTAAHGAAALRLCDRLAPGEDGDVLARGSIDAVVLGLRAGAGRNLDLPGMPCDDRIHPDSSAGPSRATSQHSEDTRHDS
jgi:hypothetical protein